MIFSDNSYFGFWSGIRPVPKFIYNVRGHAISNIDVIAAKLTSAVFARGVWVSAKSIAACTVRVIITRNTCVRNSAHL